jgi:hypothetical protein
LGKKRLAIVAPGALAYLPLAALPDPADNAQPLIAAHEVINLPSASVLALLRQDATGRARAEKPTEKIAAVLADPVFETNDPRLALARSRKAEGKAAIPPLSAAA